MAVKIRDSVEVILGGEEIDLHLITGRFRKKLYQAVREERRRKYRNKIVLSSGPPLEKVIVRRDIADRIMADLISLLPNYGIWL